MNVLAIDTSTAEATVVLGRSDAAVEVAPSDPSARHGRLLVPAIAALLERSGLTPKELDVIGVGLGPGSYTGLRVGVTAAKTLAYAVGCPLVRLDSLEIVARGAPGDALRVAVVADAQRGDLFAADFVRDAPGEPLERIGETRIEPASTWLGRLAAGTFVIARDAARLGLPLPLTVRVAPESMTRADGATAIAMTLGALASGRVVDPWFLEPLYLRRSAAEEKRGAPS